MLTNLLDEAMRLACNAFVDNRKKKSQKLRQSNATIENDDDAGVLIGETIPSAHKPVPVEEVRLPFSARLRQSAYFGQPGSGKSTCLRTTILHDLDCGNGIVNLDWQGESTDLLLAYLQEHFSIEEIRDRLVLLDYRRSSAFGKPDEPVVGFNPICSNHGDPYATAAQFKNILKQALGESVLGVQVGHDLEHVALALALSPAGPFNITDIGRVLTDSDFRQKVVKGITDEVLLDYFEQFEQGKDPSSRVLPVINKISPFVLGNLKFRDSVTNTENSYSFDEHFARVKNPIVLICVAADEMGNRLAGVAAGLLLNAAINAVMRSDRLITEEPKQGVHFVLDEAPEYAAAMEEQISRLLRVGRTFGACCSVVAQSPSNLPVSIRNLLIDVASTKCFFSQGPQQADHLAGWVSSNELPKAVIRALLMQAKPGEALLIRPGLPPCRMKARMVPYPKVDEAKVRELRRAVLAHWGARSKPVTLDPKPKTIPVGSSEPAEPSDVLDAPALPETTVEAREVSESPKSPRRRKKK